MKHSFWDIVTGAPWWVYVLFFVLISQGMKATKPRTISIKRVVILPLLFLIWSIYGLFQKLQLGFFSLIPLWIVCIAIGTYLGIREVRSWKIKVDRKKEEITLPGNYSTLILILLIFIIKFFWGYIYATHTDIPYWIYFSDVLTGSIVTGFFVGRSTFFFNTYRKS